MGIIELGMLTCDSWVGDGSDWRGRKNIAGKGRCREQAGCGRVRTREPPAQRVRTPGSAYDRVR